MQLRTLFSALPVAALLCLPSIVPAQASSSPSGAATANSAPHQSGTVKAVASQEFVLTNAAGGDVAVRVPPTARILLVDPTTRDVKSAQVGTFADIAGGDKAIVSGTPGDTGQSLTATRVYLLKSGAIAAMHAEQQAAWAHSVGGLVRHIDPATGAITVVNGSRTYTVDTLANTVVRRYAGGSVRFADAVKSTVSEIRPGDQIQARGQRSADGMTVTADEIVTGSFSNYSGLLTAVDPAAGTVTLTDLVTKKPVTVAVTSQSDLRHLTPALAEGLAHRAQQPGAASAAGAEGTAHTERAGGQGQESGPGSGRAGGGRMDLSRMVNRLPTEAVGDLKKGDAVMIVASNSGTGLPTAITMVSGVEPILAASPNGQTTLSPWSLGSAPAEGEGGEAPGGPGGQ